MMTPIWATTLRRGAISDGRRKRYVAGESNPRKRGPQQDSADDFSDHRWLAGATEQDAQKSSDKDDGCER